MIMEIALTKGRHEIRSPISGKEVTGSFFGKEVYGDVFDVEAHMETVKETLKGLPMDTTIVVYVTGLTPLFQAVFAAWLEMNCFGPAMSLDMHPGNLVFAHYDKDEETYVFRDALTGSTEQPKSP